MTAHVHPPVDASPVLRRRLLGAIELVIAVSAVGGAIYGLTATDVPRSWLDGMPFDSYVVPSVILLVAVGGGMGAAALALATGHRYAGGAAVTAGLLLITWIVVQMLVIVPDGGFSWLQPAMIVAGASVAVLGRQERSRDATGVRAERSRAERAAKVGR